MRNTPRFSVLLVIMIFAAGLAWFIWKYLVGFLAIIGGLQLLRAWHRFNDPRR